jgi:hypothetical protein
VAKVTLSALERATIEAWRAWGHAWAMFTACSGCGRVAHCKGKSRERMLCLPCYDEKDPS